MTIRIRNTVTNETVDLSVPLENRLATRAASLGVTVPELCRRIIRERVKEEVLRSKDEELRTADQLAVRNLAATEEADTISQLTALEANLESTL